MDEHRRNVGIAVGGAAVSVGALGVTALLVIDKGAPGQRYSAMGWFGSAFVVSLLFFLIGLYFLVGPWLGLPMPTPRDRPPWRGLTLRSPITRRPIRHPVPSQPEPQAAHPPRKRPRNDSEAVDHRARLVTFVEGLTVGNADQMVRLAQRDEFSQLLVHLRDDEWTMGAKIALGQYDDAFFRNERFKERIVSMVNETPVFGALDTEARQMLAAWVHHSTLVNWGDGALSVQPYSDGRQRFDLVGAPGQGTFDAPTEEVARDIRNAWWGLWTGVKLSKERDEVADAYENAHLNWRNVLRRRPPSDTLRRLLRDSECEACPADAEAV
jgi:hypothetical protein